MRRVIFVFLWVAVFGTLAWISLPNYEIKESFESKPFRTVAVGGLSQLWFPSASELAGYGLDGLHISAHVWSASTGQTLREHTLELVSPPKAVSPTFAVSSDASRIAWVAPGGVHVEPLFSNPSGNAPQAAERPLRRRVPISSLAFAGPDQLATLYADGELDLTDLTNDKVTASRTLPIAEPGPLFGKGSYLATYSPFSHDAFVVDASQDRLPLLENARYPSEILAAALSVRGRLAIGLLDSLREQGKAVQTPGAIRALVYYDLNRVLVGGDFPGIFLLGPDSPVLQAASTEPGIVALATNGSLLAYSSGRILNLVNFRMIQTRIYKGFSRPSTWLAIAFLGLLSPLAIPLIQRAARALWRKLVNLRAPPPKVAPAARADDESMPALLVEACQSGDCVLWSGTGLGAQGGLPLWNVAVLELAKWAAASGLLAPEAATPALDELGRGQTGAASDHLAQILAGHEQEVYTYLRGRYRVATDLPAAHLLIKQIDFPALISTTFDNLLDRTFPYSGGRVYTAPGCAALERAAARRDFFLLKPFGDLDEPRTILLGPAQCVESIAANPACPDFIEQLFDLRTFLFLGASLEGIERDLGLVAPRAPVQRKHYAFAAAEGAASNGVSERLRERYGIQTIAYTPSSPSHPELVEFLNRLLAAIREWSSAQKRFAAGENA